MRGVSALMVALLLVAVAAAADDTGIDGQVAEPVSVVGAGADGLVDSAEVDADAAAGSEKPSVYQEFDKPAYEEVDKPAVGEDALDRPSAEEDTAAAGPAGAAGDDRALTAEADVEAEAENSGKVFLPPMERDELGGFDPERHDLASSPAAVKAARRTFQQFRTVGPFLEGIAYEGCPAEESVFNPAAARGGGGVRGGDETSLERGHQAWSTARTRTCAYCLAWATRAPEQRLCDLSRPDAGVNAVCDGQFAGHVDQFNEIFPEAVSMTEALDRCAQMTCCKAREVDTVPDNECTAKTPLQSGAGCRACTGVVKARLGLGPDSPSDICAGVKATDLGHCTKLVDSMHNSFRDLEGIEYDLNNGVSVGSKFLPEVAEHVAVAACVRPGCCVADLVDGVPLEDIKYSPTMPVARSSKAERPYSFFVPTPVPGAGTVPTTVTRDMCKHCYRLAFRRMQQFRNVMTPQNYDDEATAAFVAQSRIQGCDFCGDDDADCKANCGRAEAHLDKFFSTLDTDAALEVSFIGPYWACTALSRGVCPGIAEEGLSIIDPEVFSTGLTTKISAKKPGFFARLMAKEPEAGPGNQFDPKRFCVPVSAKERASALEEYARIVSQDTLMMGECRKQIGFMRESETAIRDADLLVKKNICKEGVVPANSFRVPPNSLSSSLRRLWVNSKACEYMRMLQVAAENNGDQGVPDIDLFGGIIQGTVDGILSNGAHDYMEQIKAGYVDFEKNFPTRQQSDRLPISARVGVHNIRAWECSVTWAVELSAYQLAVYQWMSKHSESAAVVDNALALCCDASNTMPKFDAAVDQDCIRIAKAKEAARAEEAQGAQ